MAGNYGPTKRKGMSYAKKMYGTKKRTVKKVLGRLHGPAKGNKVNTDYQGQKRPGPHNPCKY